jgi:hypothetical protein
MYYVYVYLNKLKPGIFKYGDFIFEYEPFYVGKGKDKRYLSHLNKVKNKNKYKKSDKFLIIEENISRNIEPDILIIFRSDDELSTLDKEKETIKSIGRLDLMRGPLTNKNDGGSKPQDNYKHTTETKNKISISSLNKESENRYSLISPDGNIFENVKLNNFCKENNLDYRKIRKSANKGIINIRITSIKQSKLETLNCIGWSVINKKIFKEKNKSIKYKLTSPDNEEIFIFSGDIIKNVCDKFNLDVRTLRYYKNKGIIEIKNKEQCSEKSINCQGWQFIDHHHHLNK